VAVRSTDTVHGPDSSQVGFDKPGGFWCASTLK